VGPLGPVGGISCERQSKGTIHPLEIAGHQYERMTTRDGAKAGLE